MTSTDIFVDPPADLEMDMEIEAVKRRYNEFVATDDLDVEGTGGNLKRKVMGGKTSEAWITIFSAKDGTTSTVTTDAAGRKVKQRDENGRPYFLLRPDPKYQYARDAVTGRPVLVNPHGLQCRLHPEHPDRAWLDSIGLAGRECSKSNIPNQFQLRQHMQKKHRDENLAIEEETQRKREDEARELARMQAEAMRAMAADNRRMVKGA